MVQTRPQKKGSQFEKLREENEPKGCTAEFKAPPTLSPAAKKEWKRIIDLYQQLDAEILNDLDLAVLAAYCESVAVYQKAQAEYQTLPLVGKDKVTGKTVESPYLAIMDKAGKSISRFAEQLCLSPVGRARMGIAKAKKEMEDDPSAAFFKKYGFD